MDGVDDVSFLAGSEPRASIVQALFQEGELTKNQLVDRCDAARVTVGRNLEQLEERGYVKSRPHVWRLTPLGELLAEEFLALTETASMGNELAPLLRHLPSDAFDLDPRALEGARVTESTQANPLAPVQRHGESLMSASRARMLLPAVSPQLMTDAQERLRAGDLELETVASASVVETFRTEIPDLVADLRALGATRFLEYDGEIPFYLGLVDGNVQIGVSNESGVPHALAETGSETVRSWAESTYQRYRSAARPFEITEPHGDDTNHSM